MTRRRISLLSILTVFAVVITAAPAPAGNGKPAERFSFVEEFSDTDPFFAAACGVDTVLVDGVVKVQVSLYEDGTARVHDNTKVTFTNPDTGDQVFLTYSNYIVEQVKETLDGSLLTVVIEGTFIGNPQKWRAPGHGVIVRDSGRITIRTTLMFDLAVPEEDPGHFLGITEEVVGQNGPHPYADQGFMFTDEQGQALCEGIGGSAG